jgi:2-keto-4-pentenoate hydratase/2-oxohepta-3-ene-1,7-dioic acid hydratase in catechol pathway
MIFDSFEVLSYCCDYTGMEAGDVISLGTYPATNGSPRATWPRW